MRLIPKTKHVTLKRIIPHGWGCKWKGCLWCGVVAQYVCAHFVKHVSLWVAFNTLSISSSSGVKCFMLRHDMNRRIGWVNIPQDAFEIWDAFRRKTKWCNLSLCQVDVKLMVYLSPKWSLSIWGFLVWRGRAVTPQPVSYWARGQYANEVLTDKGSGYQWCQTNMSISLVGESWVWCW